ncbi:hypothetical protein [Flavicella sediminum]|uniref:hypothetical protein n=1 Tax=Flavicella sediminum TaxID=2585141 RepID=UPI00111D9F48|nr:hypothetical protein [Flavicella sediminum]
MKKFITKIIFLALPIIVLMFVADYYITQKTKNNHEGPGEIEVWNDIYNGNITADIAIYGSSRAWVHINSSILENYLATKVYNFGMDGHNFWLQYLRHQEYLEHNKPPKIIVLSVDVFSLKKRKDLFRSRQFIPFMFWNSAIEKFTSSYNGFGFEDYYFPLFRYYGSTSGASSLLKPASYIKPYRNKGYRGHELQWNHDLAKAKLSDENRYIAIDSSSVSLFEKFLIECKSKKIKTLFVYTPEYIEGQDFIKNRKEIFEIYMRFSEKYKIPFLDYSNDDLSHDKTFFYNASHLNKKGSDLFSKKLANDLKPLIQNRLLN